MLLRGALIISPTHTRCYRLPDYLARIDLAGRQATIRLATMGEQGVAPVSATAGSGRQDVKEESVADAPDSMPEEVFLRTQPMNLAKRNALEANRRQWGIGYDPSKPERISKSKQS